MSLAFTGPMAAFTFSSHGQVSVLVDRYAMNLPVSERHLIVIVGDFIASLQAKTWRTLAGWVFSDQTVVFHRHYAGVGWCQTIAKIMEVRQGF